MPRKKFRNRHFEIRKIWIIRQIQRKNERELLSSLSLLCRMFFNLLGLLYGFFSVFSKKDHVDDVGTSMCTNGHTHVDESHIG